MTPRICFDRHPDLDTDSTPPGVLSVMALDTSKLWPLPADGSPATLRVRFLDGDRAIQSAVIARMHTLESIAHVRFVEVAAGPSEIRVTLQPGGSWSYIGTDCRNVPDGQPTMQLGWLTRQSSEEELRSVVLHETIHSLAGIHEAQSPAAVGKLRFDRAKVYAAFGGPPNYWSRETIDANILGHDTSPAIDASAFDPYSIMMYPFDASLTVDGFGTPWNTDLTATDRAWLAKHYPRPDGPSSPPTPPIPTTTPTPTIRPLAVGPAWTKGTLDPAHPPVFRVVLPRRATYHLSAPDTKMVAHRGKFPSPIRRYGEEGEIISDLPRGEYHLEILPGVLPSGSAFRVRVRMLI